MVDTDMGHNFFFFLRKILLAPLSFASSFFDLKSIGQLLCAVVNHSQEINIFLAKFLAVDPMIEFSGRDLCDQTMTTSICPKEYIFL